MSGFTKEIIAKTFTELLEMCIRDSKGRGRCGCRKSGKY